MEPHRANPRTVRLLPCAGNAVRVTGSLGRHESQRAPGLHF